MDKQYNLQDLIDFGLKLLPQMSEVLNESNIIDESKELITTNIVLLNTMLQTAIHFKGTPEQECEFINIFSKTLEDNYNFIKHLLGY